jgi:hypothetical protein
VLLTIQVTVWPVSTVYPLPGAGGQAGVLNGGNAAGMLEGVIIKQVKSGNPLGEEFAATMTEQRQSQA